MIIIWILCAVLNLGLIVRAADNHDSTFVVVGFVTMFACFIAAFEEIHARSKSTTRQSKDQ